jgi:predicted ATP-grasp superfamily ATP-dependent carboligase
LAERCGVPAPRTARGPGIREILEETVSFSYPVVIKPRGNPLHQSTAHSLSFKTRYAASHRELRKLLPPLEQDDKAILVQEFARGVGRCVSAVCDHGRALALFAYEREREVPLSGGVSVRRRSIPLDLTLRRLTTTLLGAIGWHGVAMVEYKYDPWTDEYVLMEINGRFQASTALSLDAGLNLPHLVAALYTGTPLPEVPHYRIGVKERWLRGDIHALLGVWRAPTTPPLPGHRSPPDRWGATWEFLRDFQPGMYYDEFKPDDVKPALVELLELVVELLRWSASTARGIYRRLTSSPAISSLANSVMHRSIRA